MSDNLTPEASSCSPSFPDHPPSYDDVMREKNQTILKKSILESSLKEEKRNDTDSNTELNGIDDSEKQRLSDKQTFSVGSNNVVKIDFRSEITENTQRSSPNTTFLISAISQVWEFIVEFLNFIWYKLKRIFIWKGPRIHDPEDDEVLESGPYYHVIWVHIYNFLFYIEKFVKSYRHIFCFIPPLITFGLSIFITYISMRNSEEFVREVIIFFLIFFYLIKAFEWFFHLSNMCSNYDPFGMSRQEDINKETAKFTLDIWTICFIFLDCIYYICLAITLLSNQIFIYFKDRFPATPVV